MPVKLDPITIFPTMAGPMRAGQTFRLHWILDLTADSSHCNISLLFKNVKTSAILIEKIQPELLSFCTVGSYFKDGKKLDKTPDYQQLEFTIESTARNSICEAKYAFSDLEYDLALPEKDYSYSIASKRQFCFVQQVGNIKIIIPCFVIASAYYLKSTSLRNAFMSRNLEFLFHECSRDPAVNHARIHLKPGGNLGDAKTIARLKLNEFAQQRWKLCLYHLYVNINSKYKSLQFDFPVEQKLTITASGHLVDNPSGGKTFIAFQIVREDSAFPFDSLEIIYEKEDTTTVGEEGRYPVVKTKHNGQRSDNLPSEGLVRHLLENSDKVANSNEEYIHVIKTAMPKSPSEKTPVIVVEERETEVSFQPGSLNDNEISRGAVKQKEEDEGEKKARYKPSLDDFKKMVDPLNNLCCVLKTRKGKINLQVTGFDYFEDFVWKRQHSTSYLSLKESYDNTLKNRRRCAYVSFRCKDRNVCLVEIDQTGFGSSSCSTMVLISENVIAKDAAVTAVKGFVGPDKKEKRVKEFAKNNVTLEFLNHPKSYDDEALNTWRLSLLRKVLEGI